MKLPKNVFFTSQIFTEKESCKKYVMKMWSMLLETCCQSLTTFLADADVCLKCIEIL